jgi:hypothetical protein
MAYRVQAEASGDLDRQTARLLDQLAQEADRQRPFEGAAADQANTPIPRASVVKPIEPMPTLKPGALLTREWQGRIERVMALENGFAWNGKTYGSLSAAAFAITGKWNGRRFFLGGAARRKAGCSDERKGKQLQIDERRGTSRPPRPWRQSDDGDNAKIPTLRDLHARVDRSRSRARVQFPARATRSGGGLCKEPGPRRLEASA